MSLSDWSASGLIVEHETSPEEIQGLLSVVERSFNDAKAQGLSADGRFSFAYNAALQCAAAALAAAGYRPGRSRHHYYAIESLMLTMGESEKQVRMLDAARKKRAVSVYEIAGAVSDAEADEMLQFAEGLHKRLLAWLEKNHPQYVE